MNAMRTFDIRLLTSLRAVGNSPGRAFGVRGPPKENARLNTTFDGHETLKSRRIAFVV